MPRTLVVPGVSVEARYDVPPPLPARSGILGAVGVVDRIPAEAVKSVTSSQELFELYGPATRFSFPEAFSALINGVSEVVVSPVQPGTGNAAQVRLTDDEGDEVAILRARAVGPWANDLSVRITRTLAADRRTVRRITIEVLHKGSVIERHDNLIMRPGDDNDLFTTINRDSGTLIAIDPVFETDLPVLNPSRISLTENTAAPATGMLTSGGADSVEVSATQTGTGGNRISLQVIPGHAVLTLNDGADDPSIRIRAAVAGGTGAGITVNVEDDGSGGVNVTVVEPANPPRAYMNLTSIANVVQSLDADPALNVSRRGNLLPSPTGAPVNLVASVTVTVREEGVRTVDYSDLPAAEALVEALAGDAALEAILVGNDELLPDAAEANLFYLSGGVNGGFGQLYNGQNNPLTPILEIVPTNAADASMIRIQMLDGSEPNTVRLRVGIQSPSSYEEQEVHEALSMDPDSPRYLPRILENESGLIRGLDLYTRAHALHWPAATFSPRPLQNGVAPAMSAWQAGIDALAQEDAVDMLLAGLQEWKDETLNHVEVQQALIGHSKTQADNAKPRIALNSISPKINTSVTDILDHVGQVTDRRSVLVAPAGAEGAFAGLLGHLEYFQSPTFKTVAQPGVPLVVYSEGELNKLVGPPGNICVIAQKRGRGTICIKGIATDGFQVSVVRVADRCIREVKKISDRFIGELNNVESRNALKQMIVAVFTQMERDGALVPSVDEESPAFEVEVYASQNDVAAGNARIDIAVRPVRAIDYIYATIRVKN